MGEPCPVCTTELTRSEDRGERSFYECKRCGLFSLSYEARQDLAWHMGRNEEAPRKLSYALYRMTKQEQWAMLTTDLIANILANAELPRPQEQLENLILWMGVTQPSMGSGIQVDERALSATGAEDMGSLGFLISQASNAGLMTGEVIHAMGGDCFIPSAQLTLSGWGMFENLQRGKASGRIAFQKRFGAGLFGGEGFILQKLTGDGLAFVHAGGTIVKKELRGETLRVDTGCLVAMTGGIHYDIERSGNLKSMFFGGEGLFLTTLSGHGTVWLQSLPFSRLADRILANAPAAGGASTGEGSLLGGVGRLLGGD